IGIRHRGEHSLVEAFDRLDRLSEEHPLLQVGEGLIGRTRIVLLADPGPQCGALAVLVVVVEARLVLAAGAAGFDHPVDDPSDGCATHVPPAASVAVLVSWRIFCDRVSVSSSSSCRAPVGQPACSAACSTVAGSTPSPTAATASAM